MPATSCQRRRNSSSRSRTESSAANPSTLLLAAVECILGGQHVVWIDFEDPNESTVLLRLRALGLVDSDILERFHYYSPQAAADEIPVELVALLVEEVGASLVVVDSVGEAFGLEGINEASDEEVGEWIRRVGRRLADTGAAVVLVDHSTKANDNPLHPSGSKRKRAAITGASYYVQAKDAISKEAGGMLLVTCAKDRHGNHRAGNVVANVQFTVPALGQIAACVNVPASAAERDTSRHLAMAREVVAVVKSAGVPMSQRQILQELTGNREARKAAIAYAIQAGAITIEDGKGNTTLHVYVRDLDATDGRPAAAGIPWAELLDIAASAHRTEGL